MLTAANTSVRTRTSTPNDAAATQPTATPAGKGSFLFSGFRMGVHLILMVLFLALSAVYVLRVVHDDYFVKIVERARRTDDDLLEEFTYYDRHCNVVDITATPADADLLYIEPGTDGVDQMMTHGAVMIPELLTESTIHELRQFVVDKNAAVTGTAAEFPMSQGHNRISYGIEATEHPIVIKALKELHDNSALKDLLEGLVGENPALTEITAITAAYGCSNQVWHADVKQDGNALMWGRTYSHSYSLFVPLQNTTGAMGATDLCPGTHFCADSLHEVCEGRKIGLHQVSKHGFWKEGDAALLNQQVWHRGTRHVDRDAPERMVFIVSFLGRPTDTRQLSRGTYFHMKWNMWGHTWQDLADSATSMARPFNILRCLHIWKPKGREWGYDLLTSAALRIGNNQLGCQPEDLLTFVNMLSGLGLPEWLDGTILEDDEEAWQTYFRETIANVLNFLLKANTIALAAYFGFIFLLAIRLQYRDRSGLRTLWGGFVRLALTHGLVFILAYDTLTTVRTSPWATNIASGKTLMRPFPPVETIWRDDPSVSKGPTTLPTRQDVLFGTRLQSRTLGAYSRSLEFHPGNKVFLESITKFGGPLYRSYEKGLPSTFHQKLIDNVVDNVAVSNGRYLQQDYRNGDWRLMNPAEVQEDVRLALVTGRNSLLATVQQEIELLLADYRFGMLRGTPLSQTSQSYLHYLEKELFGTLPINASKDSRASTSRFGTPQTYVPEVPTTKGYQYIDWTTRWTTFPMASSSDFRLFQEVLHHTPEDGLIPATIVGVSEDGRFDLAFHGEASYDMGSVKTLVPRQFLSEPVSITEGEFVFGNYDDMGEWFSGRIVKVWPNSAVDIWYDDGDFEPGVPSSHYVPRGPEE